MINENKPEGVKKNKALPIIIAIIAVLVLAIIVVLAMNNNSTKTTKDNNPQANNNQSQTERPVNDEFMDLENDGPDMMDEIDREPVMNEEDMTLEQQVLAEADEVISGANKVSKDNKVLTREGKVTRNDVEPMSPEAPQQTGPIDNPDELPAEVIRITMTAQGIEPANFSVSAGSPVSLSITSGDKFTHVFKFNDEALSAVAVGVGPRETRAITFQAPDTAGEYGIYCDVPGHTARGETAVMIVQ